MRLPTLPVLLVIAFTLSACSHAEEEKQKIAEIQKAADDKIAQAENQAKVKLADMQKELDDAKAALAKAQAQAQDALNKAQSSVEDQAKAAEAALIKAREAFKAKAKLEVSDANKSLSEVSGKVSKVPAKSKATVTKLMQDIVKQQKVLSKDITAFDTATLDTFRTVNAQFEKDLASYKTKIRSVRAKVPQS